MIRAAGLDRSNGRWWGAGRASLGLLMIGALGGCTFFDNLIDVDAPSQLIADEYLVPGNATVILNGVIGDFECAFARYVVAGAMFGDELQKSANAEAWTNIDRRENNTAGGLTGAYAANTCAGEQQSAPGVYRPLSIARWHGDRLKSLLEGWTDAEVPNRTSLLASATAYAGYATLLLGEAMCSAAFDGGSEQTPAQIFTRADGRFTEAMATAQTANNTAILNLARVGRARARLNLGRKADAATDATAVPAAFVANATYSSAAPRRENFFFSRTSRAPTYLWKGSIETSRPGGHRSAYRRGGPGAQRDPCEPDPSLVPVEVHRDHNADSHRHRRRGAAHHRRRPAGRRESHRCHQHH